jgi:hypothetical protein
LVGNVYIRAERKIKTAVLEEVSGGSLPARGLPLQQIKEGKRQVC